MISISAEPRRRALQLGNIFLQAWEGAAVGERRAVMDDETVLLLSVLLPVVATVLVAFVISSIVSAGKPVWTASEAEHLRRRWPSDEPLLQDLRMVRNSEAGRRKILNQLLFEATKVQSGDESCRLLSVASLEALQPNVYMRWLMSEQLILAYTMLSAEQVAECICAAFIASPGGGGSPARGRQPRNLRKRSCREVLRRPAPIRHQVRGPQHRGAEDRAESALGALAAGLAPADRDEGGREGLARGKRRGHCVRAPVRPGAAHLRPVSGWQGFALRQTLVGQAEH